MEGLVFFPISIPEFVFMKPKRKKANDVQGSKMFKDQRDPKLSRRWLLRNKACYYLAGAERG